MPQPWEYAPKTEESLALMNEHSDKIFENYRGHIARLGDEERAFSDIARLSEKDLLERAKADAIWYDSWARNFAYRTQRPVGEFYGRYRIDYTVDGKLGLVDQEAESLFSAMYRNRAESIEEFFSDIERRGAGGAKSYFDYNGRTIDRKEDGLSGYRVILDEDTVKHIGKRYPDFTDWERIPEVIRKGEKVEVGIDRRTNLNAQVYTLKDDNKIFAEIAAPVETPDTGKHFKMLTAFKGSKKGFKNWLAENKKAIASRDAGGIPAYPFSQERPHGSGNGQNNINNAGENGNGENINTQDSTV